MTEQEWLAATSTANLEAMMYVVEKGSPRKVRLFLCACERRFWHQLPAESQRNLENSERYADGLITWPEYFETGDACWKASWGPRPDSRPEPRLTIWDIVQDLFELKIKAGRGNGRTEVAAQCDLLREVFGPLPFRPVVVDPAWLTWNAGTAVNLAQAIYDDQAFDRLPILADALEDAGCTNTDLLTHCRQPGLHVRGCWALDWVLGKA